MERMFLQSSLLRLRAPELSDLDYLFHVENDTREWMVSACKVPYSRFQLQQYIETNAHDLYVDKQLRLMIERVDDNQVVGVIDLFDFSPADRRAEMGIVVDRECRGKGYGREALMLLCDYAECVLDLRQLYAYVFEDNVSARQLFASSGFELTATLLDWVFRNKKFRSVCLYQRLFEK
jgi:diamine N-acetyltransferase